MAERTKHMSDFYVTGMRFWDGARVLDKLKVGKKLRLVAEPDNGYDGDAVAIYYKKTKLGYIPGEHNELPSQLIRFGHGDIFECRILQVNTQAEPWKQVYVGLYMISKNV